MAAAAARDTAISTISQILRPYVTDANNHRDLHTIITYYDMKKDAHADPSVSKWGNEHILKPALKELMGPRIMGIISQINTENPQYFFYALNRAMENTIYTKVKKIGRLKKDDWENNRLENTLPSFIKYGIEESSRPSNFNKDITTYLSIASYLDPYPSREQTKKAFSYDYRKGEGERIKISGGETLISSDDLKGIGVPGVSSIKGIINGYDWTCDTKINFEGSINPTLINNKFNPNFTESGTEDKEYQLGNPTKNKWIGINRGKPSIPAAIKTAKVYLLAKEIGDTCQVLLGNKLADELPKPETSPLGIFAVDTVVGMRTRLTKKMNAIIKNNGDTPLGGFFDEYNLYLCRDDPKTELLSIAQMIYKNTINYNNVIKQKYIDAYGTGFSIPSSRDVGPNHERLLDIFRRIVREINIKNALIYIMYQYLVGYIETFYLSHADAEAAREAAEAAQAVAEEEAEEEAESAQAQADAEDPRIRDIPPLRSIYDASDIALLKADEYKRRGIIEAARNRSRIAAGAESAAAAAAHNPINIRVQFFNSCKEKIDRYEEYFKNMMKSTDIFKHNSKQNTYKLAELEKYIFTDKTPFDTQLKAVGTLLGELLENKERYVRKPWNETKRYINSYTISINLLTNILFPRAGAGAGAGAGPGGPPRPPPRDPPPHDNNYKGIAQPSASASSGAAASAEDDDEPLRRRNLRGFERTMRDVTAAARLAARAAEAATQALAGRPSQRVNTPRPPLPPVPEYRRLSGSQRSRSPENSLEGISPQVLAGSGEQAAAAAAAAEPNSGIHRPTPRRRVSIPEQLKGKFLESLPSDEIRRLATELGLNGSDGGGGPGPSIETLRNRLIRRQQGLEGGGQAGGATEWNELSNIETTDMDLLKMNTDPNKFLKEKVYEFYGEGKDEMYMFSLMNSIYHYLDYVNEITVDRDILDIIKDVYNSLGRLPLELLEFNNFKNEYYRIKQEKINQYEIEEVRIPSVNITRKAQLKRINPRASNRNITNILSKERSQRANAAIRRQKEAAAAIRAATAAIAAAVSNPGAKEAAAKAAANATRRVVNGAAPPGFGSPRPPGSGSIGPGKPTITAAAVKAAAAAAVKAAAAAAAIEESNGSGDESQDTLAPLVKGGTRRQNLRYRKTRKNRKD